MILSTLLAVTSSIPVTPVWSPIVGVIISACSLVVLLLTFAIKFPKVGPMMPLLPISIPAFIGAMAFGHVIGIGVVLGLTNIGRL